jgi:hypothetical protein
LRYTGVVTNSGNITLTDVVVNNNIRGSSFPYLGPINLAPGETAGYVIEYVVGSDFCGMDNVTVKGLSICGDIPVSNSVATQCDVLTDPSIHVTSVCPGGPLERGQNATFTGTVTNTGDSTLRNILVSHHFVIKTQDPSSEASITGPLTMAPGESINFTFDLVAPADWECCELADTVTALGNDRCSQTSVSSTSTTVCPLLTHPKLLVTMDCPVGQFADGDWVEYTGTVENTGDIVLSNVTVVGTRGGVDEELVSSFNLSAGETEFFYGSYVKVGSGPASPLVVTAKGIDVCTGGNILATSSCNSEVGPESPLLVSIIMSGEQIQLNWNSTPGTSYRIQCRIDDLHQGDWLDSGEITATEAKSSWAEIMNGKQSRFYRVVESQ